MISGGFTRGNPNPHWHNIDTLTDGLIAPQAVPSAGNTWPSANLAIYAPVIVRAAVTVKKMFFGNSVSTSGGNYDIGLYDATGTALLRRGSTAKPAAATEEAVWDCTDTVISPGLYYLALVSSTNTDTFQSFSPSAPYLSALGVYTEASALPLPATATFARTQTLAFCPVIGLLLDTRVS